MPPKTRLAVSPRHFILTLMLLHTISTLLHVGLRPSLLHYPPSFCQCLHITNEMKSSGVPEPGIQGRLNLGYAALAVNGRSSMAHSGVSGSLSPNNKQHFLSAPLLHSQTDSPQIIHFRCTFSKLIEPFFLVHRSDERVDLFGRAWNLMEDRRQSWSMDTGVSAFQERTSTFACFVPKDE